MTTVRGPARGASVPRGLLSFFEYQICDKYRFSSELHLFAIHAFRQINAHVVNTSFNRLHRYIRFDS